MVTIIKLISSLSIVDRKINVFIVWNQAQYSLIIGQLNNCNIGPMIDHMREKKKIIWYLKSIMHLGSVYVSQLKDKRKSTNYTFSIWTY